MAPTRPLSLNKNNDSELSNGAVLSLFRRTACSTSVFIHGKTLKVGKIHCYNGTRKFLKRRFLHPSSSSSSSSSSSNQIDKRAHLCFSIKRLLSLRCMILGQQNRRKIPLTRARTRRIYEHFRIVGRHFLVDCIFVM